MSEPRVLATDRRRLLSWAGCGAAVALAATTRTGPARPLAAGGSPTRRLVAFYSRTGHTRQAALAVARAVGADLFEIRPRVPSPAGYQDTVDLNVRQRAAGERPAVQTLIPDLGRYDTVYVGYPIWAVDLPPMLQGFLAAQAFDGKVLAPFCTSAMSGLAATEDTIRRLCPGARVLPGLSLPGGGRGHNTLVTGIAPEARLAVERWSRLTMAGPATR